MIRHLLIASAATLALTAPVSAERGDRGGKERSAKVERGGDRQAARADRRSERRTERRVERRAERRQVRLAQADRGDRRSETRARARSDDDRGRRSERRAEPRVERAQARRDDDRRVVRVRDDDRRVVRARDDDRRIVRARDDDRGDDRRLAVRGRDRDAVRIRDFDDDDRWVANFARGVGGCPPGLANKNPLCMPPGQYKKWEGNRLPAALRTSLVPNFLRNVYRDDDDYYYRWNDGLVYRVNRDSDLINSLIPLFGGGLLLGQTFPSAYSNYHVPSYYQPFYQDSFDDYYRYNNGYVYEIDRRSGLIEDIIPLYDRGFGMGQMLPASYNYYNLPYPYRSYYADADDYYYRYAPGAIYQVDRDTQLISAIVSLLTGTSNSLAVGQPLPLGYDAYNVPYAYRSQYFDTADSWYRYNNGYIYQVDPTTRLITAVIDAIV